MLNFVSHDLNIQERLLTKDYYCVYVTEMQLEIKVAYERGKQNECNYKITLIDEMEIY